MDAILSAGPAVLVLAASDRPVSVRAAIRAGALGYVLKSAEAGQVRQAIATVAAGRDWISPRLAYNFRHRRRAGPARAEPAGGACAGALYATGMPMKSVARRMMIGEETVKQYVGRVKRKIFQGRPGCAN